LLVPENFEKVTELLQVSGNFRDKGLLDTENAENTDEHGKTSILKALSVWFREFRVFRVQVSR